MQLLATINNPRAAQAFVDYLAVQSITIEIRPLGPQQLELWVDEGNFDSAQQQFAEFSKNPNDVKYLDASWLRNADHSPLHYESGHSFIRIWLARGGWVTHAVIALCVLVFALFHFEVGETIYYVFQFPPSEPLQNPQIWRWLTPAFIHFSMLHIAFNLLWWWMLGGRLEQHFGKVFLLTFMLMTAVVSNYAQFMVSGSNNFGGLSGVVYALIGFCWLFGKLRPEQPINLENQLFAFALVWLVLGYADIFWVNIANTAHLSGLLAGLGFAAVTAKREN